MHSVSHRLVTAMLLSAFVLPATRAGAQSESNAEKAAAPDRTRPHVRTRVLGVYDEESGEPVEGADVTDIFTGITSRTTKTGTVALFFADTGGTMIRLKKVGYQPNTLVVGTALADTAPVTTTMIRAGHVLAKVVTIGNRSVRLGPADTVSELLRNGFYERRYMGGAPYSAFIDGTKLQGTLLVSNARYFGRGICEGNLYIDGMPMAVSRRTGHFLKEGVDALVNSADVAGIETYYTGDAPIDGAHTVPGAGAMDIAANTISNAVTVATNSVAARGCVTMIWLKH